MKWIKIVDFIFSGTVKDAVSFAVIAILLVYFWRFRDDILKESGESRFSKALKICAAALATFFALGATLLSIAQYSLWLNNDFSRFLLPPHQPITYFIGYVWLHFAKAGVFSAALAGLLFLSMTLLNKRFDYRFFYDEEPMMAAISVFAVPWPDGLLVIMLLLAAGIGGQAVFWLAGKHERMPLVYFWLPAAITALLFGGTMEKLLGLGSLKV